MRYSTLSFNHSTLILGMSTFFKIFRLHPHDFTKQLLMYCFYFTFLSHVISNLLLQSGISLTDALPI